MTPKTLDKYIAAEKKKYAAGSITLEQYKAKLDDMYNELAEMFNKGSISFDEFANVQSKLANAESKPELQGKKSTSGKAAAPATQDPGQQAADAAVEKIEKQVAKVYGQAKKEMETELKQLHQEFGPMVAKKQRQLMNGEITQEQYNNWVNNQIMKQDALKQKIDQCSGVMLHANEKAMAIVNGETMNVFAENANWQSYQITQDTGLNLSFAVYDEKTVENLVKNRPELLPRKVVNGKKDKAWNQGKIANAVTTSILKGESIPDLAKRIAADTASENGSAMVRYARTAMTSAQNAGRMEGLHQAQAMGIKCKKTWLAALDSRTRDAHAELDGQTVDVDEPFKVMFQASKKQAPSLVEIMYPGDPNCKEPGMLYNCRCTLIYEYEGYPDDPVTDERRDNETGELITNMNYKEWKAAKQGSELNNLNAAKVELAEAQKAFLKGKVDENKVYSNIWKDDVTLADYPDKKGSIQAKKDYYENEIAKLKAAQANGESWATDAKIKEKEKQLKLLKEFEKKGQLLEKRNEALAKVQGIYDKVGLAKTAESPSVPGGSKKAANKGAAPASVKGGQFAPNAWDEKTKKAAAFYRNRNDADNVLRPWLDKEWDKLTDEEKYAVWEYTHNSHPMNRPLSGYDDTWEDRGWKGGPEFTDWGHEDNYSNRNLKYCGEMQRFGDSRGQPSYKRAITDLTMAMEKAEPLPQDMWLVRGSPVEALAGWFRSAGMDYDTVRAMFKGNAYTEDEMRQALVGRQALNHAFTSTGIAKDSGFSGNIKYRIYAPKGTKCIYAEPQSHYGASMGSNDKIYKPGSSYRGVGGEAEVILQRGTGYVCRGLKITGYDRYGDPQIEIEFEITEQPDYFQNGDEDTYNKGATRHRR